MNREARAAEVVGAWRRQVESGDAPSFYDVIAQHPDLADLLRQAYGALAALDRHAWSASASPAPAPPAPVSDVPVNEGGEPPAGERIGDFRLLCEIGRGGMGVVYEAEQVSMGRRVALKVLHPTATRDVKATARLRREAQATGRLHHTNVVQVHAMGEDKGRWYYAMERVRGRSLAEVLAGLRAARAARTPAPAAAPDSAVFSTADGRREGYARIAHAFAGLAEALALAHREGVVHRDVKPSNLMVDEDGTVKILDFGLAALREGDDGLTLTGDVVGTPAYMSPEQARSRPVDGRADVYSLGATLYEVLTLEPPVQGKDVPATLVAVVSREPVKPRRIDPRIPRDLETIVERTLEKDPKRRYPTADELARDLRAFAEGFPIAARRVGPFGRAWRTIRRHPARSALAATIVLALAGGAVLAAGWGRAEDQRAAEAARRRRLEYDALLTRAFAANPAADGLEDPSESRGRLLDRAIALDPARPEAWYASALEREASFERSLADLEEARKRGLPERHASLARSLLLRLAGRGPEDTSSLPAPESIDAADAESATLRAQIAERDGQKAIATALLDRLIARGAPGGFHYARALLARAKSRVLDEDYGGALADLMAFRAQFRAEAQFPQVDAKVAWVWQRLGRQDEADRHVALVLAGYDQSAGASAYARFAQQCRDDGQDAWARRAWDAGLRRFPEHPVLLLQQAESDGPAAQRAVVDAILAKDPAQPLARAHRVRNLLALGQAKEALAALEPLLAEYGTLEAPQRAHGEVLEALGRFAAAERVYREGLARVPRSSRLSDGLVRTLLRQRRPEEALAFLDRMVALNTSDVYLHGQRVMVLRALGRQADAIAEARVVVRLAPDPANIPEDSALLLAWNDPQSVYPVLEAAVARSPSAEPARVQAAYALVTMGKVPDALALLEREPKLPPTYHVLALRMKLLRDTGRWAESIEAAHEAQRRWPSDPTPYSVEAQDLMFLGRWKETIPLFEKHIALLSNTTPTLEEGRWFGRDPVAPRSFVYPHNMLALALRRTGAVERALAASDAALRAAGEDAPSLAAVLVQRTAILLQLARVADAKAAAKRAVAVAPALVDAHTAMSDVLFREGDWTGAEAAQAEAIRLGGPNGRAKLRSVHAGLLWHLDRLEESAAEADAAITRGERTPFSLAYASTSRSLRPAPTPDDLRIAQATADTLRTSFPDSGWGWLAQGAAHRAAGRWREAIEALLQAYKGDDVPPGPVLALMLEAYVQLGRRDDVASVRAELQASLGDRPVALPPLVERLVREAEKAGGPAKEK